jgi:hypothetical protein
VRRRSSLAPLLTGALALLTGAGPSPAPAGGPALQPVDPAVNSPKEAVRREIFGEAASKPGCAALRASPQGATGVDATLDAFLKETVAALKGQDRTKLQPLFHKRLNIGMAAIDETFAKLASVYGKPYDVSVYKVWALNNPDDAAKPIPCPGEDLALKATYGYPLQFGVWFSLLGPNELGRIYVGVVPADGRWNLGSFHAQQWTHASKDGGVWADEAAATLARGAKEAAYVKYDIAAKLLDGGPYIDLDAKERVEKARDAVMSKADFEATVKGLLPGFDVIYLSSLLVEHGAGILVRVRIPEEISVDRMKAQCAQVVQKIKAAPWGKELTGLRCNFSMPGEVPTHEGVLGGLYVAFADSGAK